MLTNREKMEWLILIFAMTVVMLLVINSLTRTVVGLNESFIFFSGIVGMLLGAGIYHKIKKNGE